MLGVVRSQARRARAPAALPFGGFGSATLSVDAAAQMRWVGMKPPPPSLQKRMPPPPLPAQRKGLPAPPPLSGKRVAAIGGTTPGAVPAAWKSPAEVLTMMVEFVPTFYVPV